ncbi:hypothetical protein H2201_006577 [Coniosporium apollinis]|uniref:N-acetylglucosamine-6-phosphate deacetylase n=1 Tax=Coniosporium apollinis TaxID=61459 RepID=A0ABQ9NLC5_9PEZI|nr:hypothetical protein H2201_006577 [Coniosporium apollinis]
MGAGFFTTFLNCRQCINGELVDDQLVVSEDTGLILERTGYIGGEAVDLEGNVVAPGFLELQTNGVNGFHFTHFEHESQYQQKLEETAKYFVTQGVTGFWATVPTVSPEDFRKILSSLKPRSFDSAAAFLGAHTEGPYLFPGKKGAHNSSLFRPPSTSPTTTYGAENLSSSIKLATLAPELPDASTLIQDLRSRNIRVSLGHSNATYEQGLNGLRAGATGLTHTLNAMSGLQSREPGLPGLISLPPTSSNPPPPYFSLIPDGHHLHPATLSLLYRAAPSRAILITDSIELAGLPDGLYPGHAQIPHSQRKVGSRVVIDGTDTLIGSCIPLQQGVRNLMEWTGCDVAQAVRCVTENVAEFMGVDGPGGVGVLKEGRRADLCVLSEEGEVLQTWVAGKKVWEREGGLY